MKLKTAQKILKKNKAAWEDMAEKFSNTRQYIWPELKSLVKYVKDGDKILDLACGNGRLVKLFKNKQVSYIGVDNSERLIKIARKKFQIRNDTPVSLRGRRPKQSQTKEEIASSLASLAPRNDNKLSIPNLKPRFIVADALNLDTECPNWKRQFDVIFAVAFLHHIPSKELRLKILKDCYKFLKSGGFLIITVWNLWQAKLLLKYHIWPILFGWRPKKLDWKDVFIPFKLQDKTIMRYQHAFTRPELKRLIKRAGFKIINTSKGYNLIVVAKKP